MRSVLGIAALVLGLVSFGVGVHDVWAASPDCAGKWTAANGGNPGGNPPVPPPWVFGCTITTCEFPGSSVDCAALIVGTDAAGNSVKECVCYNTPHDWSYSTNDRCVTQSTGGNVTCRNQNCPAPNVCDISLTVNDSNGNGQWDPVESASMKCDCYTPTGAILADPPD